MVEGEAEHRVGGCWEGKVTIIERALPKKTCVCVLRSLRNNLGDTRARALHSSTCATMPCPLQLHVAKT